MSHSRMSPTDCTCSKGQVNPLAAKTQLNCPLHPGNFERSHDDGKEASKSMHRLHRRSQSPQHGQKRSVSPPYSRRTSRSPPHHGQSRARSPNRSKSSSHFSRKSRSRSPHHHKRHIGHGSCYLHRPSGSQRQHGLYKKGSTSTPMVKESSATSGDSREPKSSSSVADVPCTSDEGALTAEQKLEKALQAAQALAPKLPSYMAPGAANPVKFQAMQQKKKLMWNKKSSSSKWEGVSFGEGGEQMQAKFRRLMGMGSSSSTVAENKDLKEKHEKMLNDMEKQYEVSRFMTHLAKGVGLGYGASSNSDDASST